MKEPTVQDTYDFCIDLLDKQFENILMDLSIKDTSEMKEKIKVLLKHIDNLKNQKVSYSSINNYR